MSYDYLIDDLPTQLSANSIGVLASIGVHAILAFGFPNVPLFGGQNNKPIANNTTVQVVELNSLEQSRLPNLAPPTPSIPTNIPAFPNTPIANIPVPNISSSSFFFPPGGRSLPSLPSPSTPKTTPPLPPGIAYNLPPLSGPLPGMTGTSSNVWQNVPPTQTRLPGKISIPPKRTITNIPLPNTSRANDDRSLIESKKRQELFRTPPPEPSILPFEKPSGKKPEVTTSPTPQTQNNPNNSTDRNTTPAQPQANSSSSTSKRGGIPNRLPPGQFPEPGQDELASNSQPKPSPIPAQISDAEREKKLIADIRQRGQSLQEDKTNTSDEEARKNYVNWVASTKQVKPTELNITGIYPKDACIKKLKGTTVYGVVVNTQGRVTSSELIKSSGYPVFNQQAKQQVQSRRFNNNTGNSKAYRVNVNFNYSSKICPSLSVPQTAEPTKAPTTPATPASSEPKKTSEEPQKSTESSDRSSNNLGEGNNQQLPSPQPSPLGKGR